MPTSPLCVPDALARTLETRGWNTLTAVQRAVLAARPRHADMLVSSPTGSGKTIAFGLACADRLLARPAPKSGAPRVLVVTPTRELAAQVAGELAWLYGATAVRVGCVTGGTDIRTERSALRRGCDLIVGSPGRLHGHLTRRALDLSCIGCVVLDEADDMLDQEFRDNIEALLGAMPITRQTLMFTATVTARAESLARSFQRDALRIDLSSTHAHSQIRYQAILVPQRDVQTAIVNTLRLHEARAAMVFCNRRDRVDALAFRLATAGFRVATLSGAHEQQARNAAITAMRDGRARVCVATDVAARGLDLPHCSLVIHAEIPPDRSALLHRSGRTGRGGRTGLSVLIVAEGQRRRAETLAVRAGVDLRWTVRMGPEEILVRDHLRLAHDAAMRAPATADEARIAAFLLDRFSAERVATALWRRWIGRRPRPEPYSVPTGSDVPRDRTWFAMDWGLADGAVVARVLPLICRAGRIAREQVGRVRVLQTETQFEIAAEAVAAFGEAVARAEDSPCIHRLASRPRRHGSARREARTGTAATDMPPAETGAPAAPSDPAT